MKRFWLAFVVLFFASANVAAAQFITIRPLTFGQIFAGQTLAIGPTQANAAYFSFSATLTIGFGIVVPTELTRVGGTEKLPINFVGSDGLYRINNNNPVGATPFNPSTGALSLALLSAPVHVWVGGSISPPVSQKPGNYSGVIVVTVTRLL